jgi:hypothetical protein
MDPADIDPPKQSTCTSCIYKEDASNYWTASIYFKSPENGTFKRIPQMANGRLNGTLLEQDGGLTIYYMRPFSGTNKKTISMKPVRTNPDRTLIQLYTLNSRNTGFPHARGQPQSPHKDWRGPRHLPPLSES